MSYTRRVIARFASFVSNQTSSVSGVVKAASQLCAVFANICIVPDVRWLCVVVSGRTRYVVVLAYTANVDWVSRSVVSWAPLGSSDSKLAVSTQSSDPDVGCVLESHVPLLIVDAHAESVVE